MKAAFYTLGCKVNQAESEYMAEILQKAGFEIVGNNEEADYYIINSCTVTATADQKTRQSVRKFKRKHPESVVILTGCMPQAFPEDAEKLEQADIVLGNKNDNDILELINRYNIEQSRIIRLSQHESGEEFSPCKVSSFGGRVRAFVKIEDGCDRFCSYCIIPYTRGRLRSLPIPEAVEETRRLAGLGYRELVLTGIEVASYGLDLPGRPGLTDLVCAVAEAAGDMRIRLSSLEPTVVTEDFCRRLAAAKRLCRHFHLSLQSGCDRTLKAMNRKYDTAGFYRAVELLREHFPGCALTCDLIVGFPGETEQDHRETLDFIRKCAFESMHIFPYSRRPGTPADSMPGQLENAVKARRAHEAQQIARQMHLDFLRSCIGSRLSVLFETQQDGLWTGHSDSYVLVSAQGEALRGQIRQVLVSEVRGEQLFGHLDD